MREDYGDLLDLKARLETFREQDGLRLVPVIGSGLSNAVLPDVAEITDMFADEIPVSGRQRFDQVIGPIRGTALGYQNAASLVKRQAGDPAVGRAVRRAVLRACDGVDASQVEGLSRSADRCRELELTGTWNIPNAYREFAAYFAKLEGRQRGPIITTNFDPFIEIALREAGLAASAVSIPLDRVPSMDQLRGQDGTPVLHIHGHWTSNAALSTISQLTKSRPTLAGLLREVFRNSLVLVTGYSGWEDSFMRCVAERVSLADLDLLGAEILWGSFSPSPEVALQNEVLASMDGGPGFTLYLGIDAGQLFNPPLDAVLEPQEAAVSASPFGYTRLPAKNLTVGHRAEHFVEGGQPTWTDAEPGTWPLLDATQALQAQVTDWLDRGGGGGAVALGPMGEGKSMAIRQIATWAAKSRPECCVLWREPGAPGITRDWLNAVLEEHGNVMLCADDADLIAADLAAVRGEWAFEGSGMTLLLASHDRLWWASGSSLRSVIQDTLFHGISSEDATAIATAWGAQDVLPAGVTDDLTVAVTEYAARLLNSSTMLFHGQQATLFGAVLDVRHGERLAARVGDLVDRLSRVVVRPQSDVSLGDIFAAICLVQDTLDPYGNQELGVTRPVIAAMVGLDRVFADGKILDLLGREAAISYAGARIYSRHPAIARAAVQHVRAQGRSSEVARIIARAGGRLRDAGGLQDGDYRNAYLLLARGLSTKEEAVATAIGAIEGAPSLLEPRVTLISVKRRFDTADAATYARGIVSHLHSFRDYGGAIRAFLNEYSQVARRQGESFFALGLAGLALHDEIGFSLDGRRAGYALTSLAHAAETGLHSDKSQDAACAARVLMERIEGAGSVDHLRHVRFAAQKLDETRALSTEAICARLGPVVSPASRAAIETAELQVEFGGGLKINDLRRLASRGS